MPSAAQTWLRDHRRGELRLARVLRGFFADQTSRLAAAVGRGDDVDFDAQSENEKLLGALSVPMAGIMAAGAVRMLRRGRRGPRSRKDAETDVIVAQELEKFDLPEHVVKAIKKALEDLAKQDYWRDIQRTTKELLSEILKVGIEDGLNGEQLAKRINTALGGTQKVRARLIARSETTALYNSGHQTVYDSLAEDDLIVGKTWLAIVDDRVRASHLRLHNKTVKPTEDFNVGGYKAPYPGHPSLPAAERVNCRCTTISKFKDD